MNTTSENSVHIDIAQRLFTFLDCTANATVTAACDLLARPLAALCSADKAARKAARAAFDPDRRLTWWFDAPLNIALQKREYSAVHQSTVFELLLGTDHPLSCRLRRHGEASSNRAESDSGEGGRRFKPLLAKAWAKAEQKEAERLADGFYDARLAEEWAKVAELRAKRERELELKARSRRVIQPYGVPSFDTRTPDRSSTDAPSPARPRFEAYPFMRYRTIVLFINGGSSQGCGSESGRIENLLPDPAMI
jgi:hypothetical protein